MSASQITHLPSPFDCLASCHTFIGIGDWYEAYFSWNPIALPIAVAPQGFRFCGLRGGKVEKDLCEWISSVMFGRMWFSFERIFKINELIELVLVEIFFFYFSLMKSASFDYRRHRPNVIICLLRWIEFGELRIPLRSFSAYIHVPVKDSTFNVFWTLMLCVHSILWFAYIFFLSSLSLSHSSLLAPKHPKPMKMSIKLSIPLQAQCHQSIPFPTLVCVGLHFILFVSFFR